METPQILDLNITDDVQKEEIALIDSTKFIILYLLTLGIYGVWWEYKVWKFFKEKEGLDIMPAARAIFSIFFLHGLLTKIQDYAKANGYQQNYNTTGLFVAYIILNVSARLPDPFWLLSLGAGFCLILPCNAYNFAIQNSPNHKGMMSGGFNGRQIGLLIAGAAVWMLILAGLFMPEGGM